MLDELRSKCPDYLFHSFVFFTRGAVRQMCFHFIFFFSSVAKKEKLEEK